MKRALIILVALALAASLRPAPRTAGSSAGPAPQLLGGFNGLMASYIWLHASRRADAGQPYELVRAARWVSALQPGLGSLYDFQAWNLAVNVADTFGAPAERWPWVEAGLNLLYDEGLARRGDDPRVPGALASLLLDRVCGGQGDAAEYYRQAFAARWWPLVGAPPTRWDTAKGLARYRMDPRQCAELDRALGPLDWRTGWPHALYWARRAALAEPSARRARPLWELQIEALRGACLDGKIISQPGQPVFVSVPQPELAARVNELYAEALQRLPEDAGLRAGRRHWSDEAAPLLAAYGQPQDDAAVRRGVALMTGSDQALAQSVAESYAVRGLLCGSLGQREPERGLLALARTVAEVSGLAWEPIEQAARTAAAR